jgi:hypothetical protein
MSLEGVIGNIRWPYLIVNGKQDAQSAYTNTEEIVREAENAGVKVTYRLYEEGTHGQLSVDRTIGLACSRSAWTRSAPASSSIRVNHAEVSRT